MKKKKWIFIFWIIFSTLVVLNAIFSYLFGQNLSVLEMIQFLDSLLIVSAIVFGIVGAWLAIIWQNTTSSSQEQHDNISYLKKTVFCSFAVITFSLMMKFSYPIIKNTEFLLNDVAKMWIRRIFIFCSGMSGLLLMLALFLTLLSFDFFSFEYDSIKQQQEQKQEFGKGQSSQVNIIRKFN